MFTGLMLIYVSMAQTIELKVDMVALHEKRLRKCLSKVKGKLLLSPQFFVVVAA